MADKTRVRVTTPKGNDVPMSAEKLINNAELFAKTRPDYSLYMYKDGKSRRVTGRELPGALKLGWGFDTSQPAPVAPKPTAPKPTPQQQAPQQTVTPTPPANPQQQTPKASGKQPKQSILNNWASKMAEKAGVAPQQQTNSPAAPSSISPTVQFTKPDFKWDYTQPEEEMYPGDNEKTDLRKTPILGLGNRVQFADEKIVLNPQQHTKEEVYEAARRLRDLDLRKTSTLDPNARQMAYDLGNQQVREQNTTDVAREMVSKAAANIDKQLQSSLDALLKNKDLAIASASKKSSIFTQADAGMVLANASAAERKINLDNLVSPLLKDIYSTIEKNFNAKEIMADAKARRIDPEEYISQYLAPQLIEHIQNAAYDKLVERQLPKGDAQYLMQQIERSVTGSLINAITSTKEQKEIRGQAYALSDSGQNRFYKPSTAMELTGVGLQFAADAPVMGVIAKGVNVAMPLTRAAQASQAVRLANKGWIGRIGVGTGHAMASTWLNLAGYNVLSTVAGNLATGQKTTAGQIVEALNNPGAFIGLTGKMFNNVFARVGVKGMNMTTGQWLMNATKKQIVNLGAFSTEAATFVLGDWLLGKHEGPLHYTDFIESAEQLVAMKIGGGHFFAHPKESFKRSFRASSDIRHKLSPEVAAEIDAARGSKEFYDFIDEIFKTKDAEVATPDKEYVAKQQLADKYKTLTENLSWDAENALNIILFGVGTGIRPRSTQFLDNPTDKVVYEVSKDKVLSVKRYSDNEERDVWIETMLRQRNQFDARDMMQRAHNAALERIMSLDPTSPEFAQYADEFINSLPASSRANKADVVRQMQDPKTDIGKQFLGFLSDKTGVLDALAEIGLTYEDATELINKNPHELTTRDIITLDDIFNTMVELASRPVGEIHTEIEDLSGRKAAEKAGAGTENPDKESFKALSDAVDAAQKAYQDWLAEADPDGIRQLFKAYVESGDEMLAYWSMLGDGYTEEQMAIVANYLNAKTRQQAFMDAAQDKIEESAQRFGAMITHVITGNVHIVVDATGKEWYVINGDFTHESNVAEGNPGAKVTITDDTGFLLAVDEQGNLRTLKGDLYLTLNTSREDMVDYKRKQLTEINAAAIAENIPQEGSQTGGQEGAGSEGKPQEGAGTEVKPGEGTEGKPAGEGEAPAGGETPEEAARRNAEEEARLKAEQEAAERAAAEEAERQAKEEAERQAAEEAARLKAEQEAAERAAKEEAERQAKEEAERIAREEAERKAKEEAEEAERKAAEEAARLKAEQEAARQKDIKEKEDIIKADTEATEDEKLTALEYLHGEATSDIDKFIYDSIMQRHEDKQAGTGEGEEGQGQGEGEGRVQAGGTPPAAGETPARRTRPTRPTGPTRPSTDIQHEPLSAEENESSSAFDYCMEAQNDRFPDRRLPSKKAPALKITDYCDGKNAPRNTTKGVFHDQDGFGVVTNGFIVYYDRSLYDESQSGKIISTGSDKSIPKGDEIPGKFPNWKSVIPSEEQRTYSFNPEQLAEQLAGIESRVKEFWSGRDKKGRGTFAEEMGSTFVFLRLPDGRVSCLSLATLKNFVLAARQLGATEVQTVGGIRTADGRDVLFTRTQQGGALAMPTTIVPTTDRALEAGLSDYFVDLKDSKYLGRKSPDTLGSSSAPAKKASTPFSASGGSTAASSPTATPTETITQIDHENRRKKADKQGGSLARKEEDKRRVDAAAQEVKNLLKGWGKKFIQAGTKQDDTLQVNFAGLNKAQMQMVGQLLRASTKLGYELARQGFHKFEDWAREIGNTIGEALKQATGWNDNDITDFCTQLWEQRFTDDDGQRKKLSEHASDFEKKAVTLPEGDTIEQHPELERREKENDLIVAIGSHMKVALRTGGKAMGINELRKLAKEFGLEDISDTDLQELAELAAVQQAKDILKDSVDNLQEITKEQYDQVVAMHEKQPALNKRDSDRVEKQQYSTPTPYSAAMAAFIKKGKAGSTLKVLEPSAGNGALTIGFPREDVHANEIDHMRAQNLRRQGFGTVTTQDGTKPFANKYDVIITNPPFSKPGTKLPPMVRDGRSITGLDGQMAINALDAMKDDGRAAIIIGGHTKYDEHGILAGKDKDLYMYLYQHYNVVDVINVDGSLYGRNGTKFPTRLILIDGRRTDQTKKYYPPTQEKARTEAVKSYDELWERVNESQKDKEDVLQTQTRERNGRSDTVAQGTEETNGEGTHGDAGENGRPGRRTGELNGPGGDNERVPGLGGTTDIQHNGGDNAEDGGRPGGQTGISGLAGAGGASQHGAGQSPAEGDSGRGLSADTGDGHRPGGDGGHRPGGRGLSGTDTGGGRRGTAGEDIHDVHHGRPLKPTESKPEQKPELADEKVDYAPRSEANSLGTKTPAALVQQTKKMLDKIGDVDQFVVDRLGYANKEELYAHLGAEQIDAVAAAIYQMEHGNGFIIGDGTGVGKGRQAASLIRYGMRMGKVPIFVTQKPQLFTDIYRDILDIGSADDFRPIIINTGNKDSNIAVFNETTGKYETLFRGLKNGEIQGLLDYVKENGKLPPYVVKGGKGKPETKQDYNCVLITYSQVAAGTTEYVDGQPRQKRLGRGKSDYAKNQKNGELKRELLKLLARDNIVVMDESHTAAGAASGYFMDALSEAAGVAYLSGTFAKRPDSMPLYALKTAIGKGVDDVAELIAAVQRGGVTLQEIMSQQLAEAGQMIRRERPTEGVVNNWVREEKPEVVEVEHKKADALTDIFNDIIAFQATYVREFLDNIREHVRDAMISIGERPGTGNLGIANVPFASKTYNLVRQMTLALKVDQAADKAIQALKEGRKPIITVSNTMEGFLKEYVGDSPVAEPDLASSMMRGLAGVLRYSRDKDPADIRLSDMSPEAQAAYHAIEDKIKKASTGLSLSPIDAMIHKLQQAGYKVGELTGRDEMLEYLPDGMVRRVKRSDKNKKKLADQFNLGQLDALIINRSSATGISLHSGARPPGFKLEQADTRQREMILAQLETDINDAIQVLGRINRTGQVHPAMYTYIMSNVPAENRLLMMYQAKVNSLFANTSGDQKSEQNKVDVVDIINKYGDQIVAEYLAENTALYEQLLQPFKENGQFAWTEMTTYDGAMEQLGEIEKLDHDGAWASRVLSRLALLPVKEQVRIMDEIEERYRTKIDILNESGENTLVMNDLPLNAKTVKKEIVREGSDPEGENPFAGHTYAETVECDVLTKPMSAAETRKTIEKMTEGVPAEQRRTDIVHQIHKKIEDATRKAEESFENKLKKTTEAEYNRTKKGLLKQRKNGEIDMSDERIEEAARESAENIERQERELFEGKKDYIAHQYDTMLDWLESFMPGDAVSIPIDNNDTILRPARMLGWKFGKSLTPASSTIIFATADGRRKVSIKMSDKDMLRRIYQETNKYKKETHLMSQDSNWDQFVNKGGSRTRETRTIYTGNLLAVLASDSPGKIVRYTTDTGEIKTGILLPEGVEARNFNEYPISAALDRIRSGEAIFSTNGDIRIQMWIGGSCVLDVPRSTSKGQKYFLDNVLRSYVRGGNFSTVGEWMRGIVPKEDLPAVLDYLSTKHGVKVKPPEGESSDTVSEPTASFRTADDELIHNINANTKVPSEISSGPQAAEWAYKMISAVRRAESALGSTVSSRDYSMGLLDRDDSQGRRIDVVRAEDSAEHVNKLLNAIEPKLREALKNSTSPVARRYFENLLDRCKQTREWYDKVSKGDLSTYEGERPMFSIERPSERSLGGRSNAAHTEAVQRRTKELSDKYGVPVRLIMSPDEITNRYAREAIDKGERITGWYDEETGEVCFYMPNIRPSWKNPSVEGIVDKLYTHEVIAHKGLRLLLGEEKFNKLCDDVWEMMSKKLSKEELDEALQYTGVAERKDKTNQQRAAANEYMAYLSEKGIKQSVKDRIVAFVKKALRSIGVNIEFSDSDIIDMLARSQRNLSRGNRNAKETAGIKGTLMSADNEKILKDVNGNIIDRNKRISSHDEGSIPMGNGGTSFHIDDTPADSPHDPLTTARRIAFEERTKREERMASERPSYASLARSSKPEERRVLFSIAPDPNYDSISGMAQKISYADAVSKKSFAWHEAWVDNLKALEEMQKALTGRKKDSEILDAHNVYRRALHVSSVIQNQQKEFLRDKIKPLQDAAEKVMGKMRGGHKVRYDDLHDYMWMKSALERNRVLKVRDYIEKASKKVFDTPDELSTHARKIYDILEADPTIPWGTMTPEQKAEKKRELANKAHQQWLDELKEEWKKKRAEEKQKLDMGTIDLREFYGNLDAWIKSYFPRYKPGKMSNDYSALHTHEMVGTDPTGKLYNDDSAIQAVMDFEEQIGTTDIENLWEAWRGVTQFSLDKAYDSGNMNKTLHDHISTMMDWYVPMRGWNEAMAEDINVYFSGAGKIDPDNVLCKKAKGRKTRAETDIFAEAMRTADNAISSGEYNKVKQALWRLAHATKPKDGDGLLSISQCWEVRTFDAMGNEIWTPVYCETDDTMTGEQVAAKVKKFNEDMQKKAAAGDARVAAASLSLPYRFARQYHKDEHIVEVSVAGKKYLIYVNSSPRAAQALNGQLHAENEGTMKLVRKTNRFLAASYTSWRPKFVLRNLFKDWNFSSTNAFIKYGFPYWVKFQYNWLKALAGTPAKWWRYNKGTLDMSDTGDRLFDEFLKNGGKTGYVAQRHLDEYKMKMTKALASSNKVKLRDAILWGIPHLVEGFNNWAENVARFAAFRTSRQMGVSTLQAIADAKNFSTNFNRKGAYSATAKGHDILSNEGLAGYSSEMVHDLWIFLNPGIQSLSLTKNNFKEHPVRSILAYGIHAAFSAAWPSIMAYWIASQFDDEEDGPQNKYANIPEYIRRSNLCIYLGNGSWAALPVAIETSAAWSAGQLFAAQYMGHTELQNDLNPVMDAASTLTQLLPIDPLSSDPIDISDTKKLFVAMSPTIPSAVVQVFTNTKWTGGPIEREPNSWDKDKPKYTRAFQSTSPFAVDLCKKLSNATSEYNNSEIEKGWADYSPGAIETLFKAYLGGPSDFFIESYSTAKNLSQGKVDLQHMPVINGIYTKTGHDQEEYRINSHYYKMKEIIEKKKQALKAAEKLSEDGTPTAKAAKIDIENKWGKKIALWDEYNEQMEEYKNMLKDPGSDEEAALLQEKILRLKEDVWLQLKK